MFSFVWIMFKLFMCYIGAHLLDVILFVYVFCFVLLFGPKVDMDLPGRR